MGKLIYLAHYDVLNSSEIRNIGSLAGVSKLDYIFKVLNDLNLKTTVISACTTYSNTYSACEKIIYPNVILKLLPSVKCNNKISRKIAISIFKIRLFLSLLREVKKNDTLFVYHSLSLIKPIKLLKKLRKFNLVLEIEEVYGDVLEKEKISKSELKFFNEADGYLFASKLLESKINTKCKPYAIINGTYNVEQNKNNKFNDGKIHIVYAGTFDPRKGSIIAANVARYLDNKYHIHIMGFGSNEEKLNLISEIEHIAEQCTCSLTFDGCLIGEEYIKFIQKCDIGLSTQDPHTEFNSTSFPSKILSYMSNGLRVVSIKIPAIETSGIGNKLYYYTTQKPSEIADTIMKIDLNDNYDGREYVKKLHDDFSVILEKLIKDMNHDL